jgi:hypothetical protein
VRSYFFKNDFETAKAEVLKDVEAAVKSGAVPPKDN